MSKAKLTIGFDIGGTNTRAGVVDERGHVLDVESTGTPHTAEGLQGAIVGMVNTLRDRGHADSIGSVGLAVAGFLDPDCEVVRFAPHLPWQDNAPVRKILQEELKLPVRLEHDANSAAWGEYRFGAAQKADTWVLFAVGTGIGATLMQNGEIYRGAYGTAPEFGHVTVVSGGRACSCGKQGCLERYASGTALVDTAVEIASKGGFESCKLYRKAVDKRATGNDVVAAARAGDALGLATMDHFAHWLGQGLSMVCDVLDPELIVLGGGVGRDADLFLSTAEEIMSRSVVGAGFRPLPRLETAELGSQAGMIGVADLARHLM